MGPIEVPTKALVRGITIISKIIKGTDLIRFIIIPKTPFSFGIGFIPILSVTTRITPRGIPSRYKNNEEATVTCAHTRALTAGSLLGAGPTPAASGHSSIQQRRASGLQAAWLQAGDALHLQARAKDGAPLFGAIDLRLS